MRSSWQEPDVTSYSAAISACEKGLQWEGSLEFVAKDEEVLAGAERDQLQCGDQRLPEAGSARSACDQCLRKRRSRT